MNALAHDYDGASATEDAQLQWLIDAVQRNRFIPAPAPKNVFVGDGDFRAIGAEFLGHLVRLGGLRPEHRVLDVGSGIGRIAAPLTQWLLPTSIYLGLDPARDGIDWCLRHITMTYPNFHFRHLDVAHPLYNRDGLLRGASLVLPVGDASIDFALLVSVVTHLPPIEVANYAREIARTLAPGGRCFVTCYSVGPDGVPATVTDPRCGFKRLGDVDWTASPGDPLGMVAFDDGWLEGQFESAGLSCEPLRPGSWRGISSAHYQDVLVAHKPGGRS